MTNDDDAARDAPPAVPEWEPSELAWRIARGHGGIDHFPEIAVDELARMVQGVMDSGRTKRFHNRLLHWDPSTRVAVLVNPIDADGGTVFLSDEQYFNRWGYADMENR